MIKQLFALTLLAVALAIGGGASNIYAQNTSQRASGKIADARTTTGTDGTFTPACLNRTFMANGTTSAGAGAATIDIEATNEAVPTSTDWTVVLGSISLTLSTTKTSAGFVSFAPWRNVRANVTAISGTNATVTVWLGC